MNLIDLSSITGTSYSDLSELVYSIINFAIAISALVTVISIITTGFKYMLSAGDSKKIESANKSLAFSLIGLVLVFVSPTVIEFVITQLLKVK